MFFDLRKIQKIPNSIDNTTLDSLYESAKVLPKKTATVGKIINGKYTTDYHNWCTADFVEYESRYDLIQQVLPTIVEKVEKIYKVKCIDDPEIHFLCYNFGTYYKSHIDGQYVENGIAKRGVDRDITSVLYLNDDYEGGAVNFDFFNLTIKPKKNDLLIYPTTLQYQHSVSEVKGIRYAIVFWFKTNPHINIDVSIPTEVLNRLL